MLGATGVRSSHLSLVIAASAGLAACSSSPQNALLAACEEVLLARLVSPTGYERIETDYYEDVMTASEFIAWRGEEGAVADAYRRGIEDGHWTPILHRLFIEYDAPNAFGTPIRSTSMCEYASSDGDISDVKAISVEVDGFGEFDWLVNQLNAR